MTPGAVNAHDLAGAPDGLALLHVLPLAEECDPDVVLLEVERDPGHAVLELEPLQGDAALEPVDAGDAVPDLEDGPDLAQVGLDIEPLDAVLEDGGDLFRSQLQGCAPSVSARSRTPLSERRSPWPIMGEPPCSPRPPPLVRVADKSLRAFPKGVRLAAAVVASFTSGRRTELLA